METGLRGKFIEGHASELFRSGGGQTPGRHRVTGVERRGDDEQKAYKFWKMLSKREAKGSSDGAGEADSGEGSASEETVGCSVEARALLLV